MSRRRSRPLDMEELRRRYGQGENLMRLLNQDGEGDEDGEHNSPEAILVSYDLQTGSYVDSLADPEAVRFQAARAAETAALLSGLSFGSLLEAGCGEATSLVALMRALPVPPGRVAGLDISWSRARQALAHSRDNGLRAEFAMADMARMPLPDNAFELVFTSHAIEPNSGREEEILRELARVTARYAALVEPCFELATPEMREHMRRHRYVRELSRHAREAGFRILEHRLLPETSRGRTAMLLLEKPHPAPAAPAGYACPRCRSGLLAHAGHLFCERCLLVYPVIDSIPCLHAANGVLASAFPRLAAT